MIGTPTRWAAASPRLPSPEQRTLDTAPRLAEPRTTMKSLRSRSGMRLALTLWAFLVLLPPGAWALCLGAQGHVALEPVATSCQQETSGCGRGESSCSASDCHGCEDVLLVEGIALHPEEPQLQSPTPLPVLHAHTSDVRQPLTSSCGRTFVPTSHTDRLAALHVVLRC